jgi:hypothetical protein
MRALNCNLPYGPGQVASACIENSLGPKTGLVRSSGLLQVSASKAGHIFNADCYNKVNLSTVRKDLSNGFLSLQGCGKPSMLPIGASMRCEHRWPGRVTGELDTLDATAGKLARNSRW